MPIIIPKDIPAYKALLNEKIFVMSDTRAVAQDIRPIEIAIVNLMPTKLVTEQQLMRLLSNTPLQVNVTLIATATYRPKHIEESHLNRFYKNFEEVKNRKFDGMIITGAPVETLDFEEVAYWKELCEIMDFSETNVTSTIFICWGAQAGLYYRYGIKKHLLPEKLFGVYPCKAKRNYEMLLKGLDDVFYIPMSRHTAIDEQAVKECKDLYLLASGKGCGHAIIRSKDGRRFYFTGHSEYDRETLEIEYKRDLAKGMDIQPPLNFYDEKGNIKMTWKSTANLLFYNWLNYYVYQITPYDIDTDVE